MHTYEVKVPIDTRCFDQLCYKHKIQEANRTFWFCHIANFMAKIKALDVGTQYDADLAGVSMGFHLSGFFLGRQEYNQSNVNLQNSCLTSRWPRSDCEMSVLLLHFRAINLSFERHMNLLVDQYST